MPEGFVGDILFLGVDGVDTMIGRNPQSASLVYGHGVDATLCGTLVKEYLLDGLIVSGSMTSLR